MVGHASERVGGILYPGADPLGCLCGDVCCTKHAGAPGVPRHRPLLSETINHGDYDGSTDVARYRSPGTICSKDLRDPLPNERDQSEMRLAYLEKIDPARKMSRFYAICVTPTLFGQWAVVREWGRIGQAGAVRENWLKSESEASAAGTKLRRQKERRGYRAL